jgi:hypothetical protein
MTFSAALRAVFRTQRRRAPVKLVDGVHSFPRRWRAEHQTAAVFFGHGGCRERSLFGFQA